MVFIAADIHGTYVNNLTYQAKPFTAQIATDTFEITVGPIAFDAPSGPTIVGLAALLGLITPAEKSYYDSLPMAGKDAFLTALGNGQLTPLGYDTLGLQGSSINATLVTGQYVAGHVYGWTEFEIDKRTQTLTVTTWGIEPYTTADLATPSNVVNRQPAVIQRFVVTPK